MSTNRCISNAIILFFVISTFLVREAAAQAGKLDPLAITANFADRELSPTDSLEFTLSRSLQPGDGSLAVFIGTSDVTPFFESSEQTYSYHNLIFPLAAGDTRIDIYLIAPAGEWKAIAEIPLKIRSETPASGDTNIAPTETASTENPDGFEFTPNVVLNVKSQNQIKSFPDGSAPERNPFTDLAGQGTFSIKIAKSGWALSNQIDLAGSSFRQEALRFGELENKAPQIDLSSYLVELSKGRFKINLGHVSFGSNRHLINGFSSRGFTVTVPLGAQNEISFAAANGTSIVGYGNLLGISRKKHSLLSTTFAREFLEERPGGLRLEFSVTRGSLLPLGNFNQGEINDAEKSLGFGFRVLGNDKKQRLRYEAGFTRSKFTNPSDPLLEQEFEVTKLLPITRNAYYGEISFDLFQDLKTWKEKTFKLTGTYRHEEIEPLFRSIAAFTQADRRRHQFEVSGNLGEMSFGFGNLRERDNLNDIASILKTLTRRNNVRFGMPLNSFFTPEKPNKWLPVVSYTFDHVHQFGASLPQNGEFADESQVPDQQSYNHVFNTQWAITEKISIAHAYTRGFQDNRQPGRENADFATASNAVTVNYKPSDSLGLDFELSRERQKNFEQPRIDRTFRAGTRGTWQPAFLKNSVFSGGFSVTLAGDLGNLSDARNVELDAQWAYNFSYGEKKFKKFSGQFFVRFANRYGDTIDRQFFLNSINKAQTFNAGLTVNLF